MKHKTAPTKREMAKIAKIRNVLSDIETYYADHAGNMYSVNVKLHGQNYYSPESIANEVIASSPDYIGQDEGASMKAKLLAELTDEKISQWCDWYITDQADYVMELLNGCDLSSDNWYSLNLLPKIEAGEATGYPYIDNLKTKAQKIKQIKALDAENKKQNRYIEILNNEGAKDKAGFYGRMGGHFCLIDADIDEELDNFYNDPEYNDHINLDYLLEQAEAVNWFLNKVEEQKNAMIKTGFHDEIIYRATELADELLEEIKNEQEIATAQELAKKHGYILAKPII